MNGVKEMFTIIIVFVIFMFIVIATLVSKVDKLESGLNNQTQQVLVLQHCQVTDWVVMLGNKPVAYTWSTVQSSRKLASKFSISDKRIIESCP